ncbi:unnamed protein product [Meganyctiphanes norvegica]|uniref:Uncharacterized protein n=1 Tax=Meganyctiphanes norvegica TaxID=48144 RepID=A0AAV2R8V3_MEGNR
MDQQTILLFIALLTTAAVRLSTAVKACYSCSDVPGHDEYDSQCGAYDYRGHTHDDFIWQNCFLKIYECGYVTRGGTTGYHEEGYCSNWPGGITCYCQNYYCNTDSYCEKCVSSSTPGTPEHTTITTTEPLTTTYTSTTTAEPPSPTTDATLATTSDPAATFSCYNCMDCATVDEDTTPIIEDKFLSCSTIVILESVVVIRGGNYDAHPDGECVTNTGSVQCWCTGDICNRNSIRY